MKSVGGLRLTSFIARGFSFVSFLLQRNLENSLNSTPLPQKQHRQMTTETIKNNEIVTTIYNRRNNLHRSINLFLRLNWIENYNFHENTKMCEVEIFEGNKNIP